MREDEFYICEEDNVFDELSALYEELKPSLYADAPGLDPDLEWGPEDIVTEQALPTQETDYSQYSVDFQCGDILLADVFQYGNHINKDHIRRPFLVIYANAYRAYGFQLTTSHPASLLNYIVEIPNYTSSGLRWPSSFNLSSIVSIELSRLVHRIGHITEEQKQVVVDKLQELGENLEELDTYGWWTTEKINQTLANLARIHC